ncbi:MAG TPA: hypothetical protein VK841_23630 [Polyangiaceae bacterium]|jgi:hypothetical protein|nr:hypothetical protein [Polyangiaceae bacterium]
MPRFDVHVSSIPLVLATAAFLLLVLWRVRPLVPATVLVALGLPWGRKAKDRRDALARARERIETAADERARALALCDAAEIVARTVTGAASAKGFYQRAMRSDPGSVEVVRRTAAGLAGRPRALESLMWRHLASSAWEGPSAEASRAALEALRALYEGPLRNAVRARAIANASRLVGASKER